MDLGKNNMYKIREAVQMDCNEIGKVYCASWKTAYQSMLPQTYLDSFTVVNCISDKVSVNDVVLVKKRKSSRYMSYFRG